MILVFSNRSLILNGDGLSLFKAKEDDRDAERNSTLSMAEAIYNSEQESWTINLIADNLAQNTKGFDLSCEYLNKLAKSMATVSQAGQRQGLAIDRNNKNSCDWIFYIPGYSSSLEKGLNRARELEKFYAANVMLFSWPANPPINKIFQPQRAYRHTQESAKIAAPHLQACLQLLGSQFVEIIGEERSEVRFNFCLLIHSLGHYLFEQSILSLGDQRMPDLFHNIAFHQPDINKLKITEWLDQVSVRGSGSLYITFNKNDGILRLSETINGPRVGGTPGLSEVIPYNWIKFIDFTDTKVGRDHWMFAESQFGDIETVTRRIIKNDIRLEADILDGGDTDPPLTLGLNTGRFSFDPDRNIYRFRDLSKRP